MKGKICIVGGGVVSAGVASLRAEICSFPVVCLSPLPHKEENIFEFNYSKEVYEKPISITKVTKATYSFGYNKRKLNIKGTKL